MKRAITFNIIQAYLAMFIAWFSGYIYCSIRMVHFTRWGYVTDFSFVLSGTGIVAATCIFTFVPLTIYIFKKIKINYNYLFFPIATLLSSQIALSFLISPFNESVIFGLPFTQREFYYTYAGIIGLVFGVAYLVLQNKYLFGSDSSLLGKTILFSSPILFLLFLFYIFPYLIPSIAYKYFGDDIKDRAIIGVLSKYKTGDNIMDLKKDLPNFGGHSIGTGSILGERSAYRYEIEYENGIITKLYLDER
ncbi:MAG: hypothetical protein ACU4F9_07845 [Arcticibacter sp.]